MARCSSHDANYGFDFPYHYPHYVESGTHDGHHAYFCLYCGSWLYSLLDGWNT